MSIEDLRQIARDSNKRVTLLQETLGAAVANDPGDVFTIEGVRHISLEAKFVRAGGGTTCKVWVQTSLDNGVTFFDIAAFAFTTTSGNKVHAVRIDPATALTPATVPASATLADDTVLNGILGNKFRCLLTTTGTYTGASSIEVHAVFRN